MCNLFFCTNPQSSKHSLILLSTRDEILSRPTDKADWRNGVLSGVDLQDPAKGTWFAVNEQGKVGVLLSTTQLRNDKMTKAVSRGTLAHDYLRSHDRAHEYCQSLANKAHMFNGFTFVALERDPITGDYETHSLTNALVENIKPISWPAGSYVIGNCPPHTTYGKMKHGRKLFEDVLNSFDDDTEEDVILQRLIEIGHDNRKCWPDEQLSSQIDEFDPVDLSSIFVRLGTPLVYGTRCFTVLLVDKDGRARLHEKRLVYIDDEREEWKSQDFHFTCNPLSKE